MRFKGLILPHFKLASIAFAAKANSVGIGDVGDVVTSPKTHTSPSQNLRHSVYSVIGLRQQSYINRSVTAAGARCDSVLVPVAHNDC